MLLKRPLLISLEITFQGNCLAEIKNKQLSIREVTKQEAFLTNPLKTGVEI